MKKRSLVSVPEANQLPFRERFLAIGKQLNETFIKRDEAIEVVMLATLAGEHYMFVGEPGTAKSAIVNCFAKHVTDAKYFKITLGSFTPPEAVFGPLDIEEFTTRKRYKHNTEGMAPWADLMFLDEGFKASDGLINSMLTLLNEREFAGEHIPLHSSGMATNWPELESRSDNVKALHDRFLLRCIVNDLTDSADLVAMMKATGAARNYTPEYTFDMSELREVCEQIRAITICDEVLEVFADLRNRLAFKKDSSGATEPAIAISGRRMGQLQTVLKAKAWLAGETEVTVEHFDVLRFGLWNDRKDVEMVTHALKTLDQAITKQILDGIDNGRREYREIKKQGERFDNARINRCVDLIHKTAQRAKEQFNRPVLTAPSKELIRKSMATLKDDFEDLKRIAASAQSQAEVAPLEPRTPPTRRPAGKKPEFIEDGDEG